MDDARRNRRNRSKVPSNSKGDSRLYLWQLISNQMTKKRKYLPTHNLPGKYESYKAKQRPTNKSRSASAQQTQSVDIRTPKKNPPTNKTAPQSLYTLLQCQPVPDLTAHPTAPSRSLEFRRNRNRVFRTRRSSMLVRGI